MSVSMCESRQVIGLLRPSILILVKQRCQQNLLGKVLWDVNVLVHGQCLEQGLAQRRCTKVNKFQETTALPKNGWRKQRRKPRLTKVSNCLRSNLTLESLFLNSGLPTITHCCREGKVVAAVKARWLLPFSCSVMSDSLWPHGLQHTRLPCPLPSPGVYPKPCPLSQRCHPTISSSVAPFSSCPQSPPASGSFPMSWLFALGGPSIGASASASVLPMNVQNWFPIGLTGLISLLPKGLWSVFSSTTVWKYQFFGALPSLLSSALTKRDQV